MFVSCWSVKGGSGTTVVAASLALIVAASAVDGVLLVDLAGDVPAVLGVAEPPGPGIAEWLAAGSAVPPDGLARLEVPVARGVRLLPRGHGSLAGATDRLEVLAGVLAMDHRPVIVDAGQIPTTGHGEGDGEPARVFAASATQSLLISRCCYLSLRRAVVAGVHPSGVILVQEKGRALGSDDVSVVVGAPVVATVHHDPLIARAVDAGLLAARLPSTLAHALRHAA